MASLPNDPRRMWLCTTYSGALVIAMANDECEARRYVRSLLATEARDANDMFHAFEMLELNISMPFARIVAEPGIGAEPHRHVLRT